MAAPSIPNLLSMRSGGRGGDRGGGRGGGRRSHRDTGSSASGVSPDAIIQDTDTDAAVSRLSMVDLGYFDDQYARYFVSGPPTRRLPIINRGTYVRSLALDLIVVAFLSESHFPEDGRPKQVISLGAGTDTRPFRMLEMPNMTGLIYHEIDFEPTCRKKHQIVRSTPGLAGSLRELQAADDGSWSARHLQGGRYHCHAADLRNVHTDFSSAMPASIRTDVPTLIISECCLCYLTEQDSARVLDFFHTRMNRLAIIIYEPMPLDDAFGKVMVSNLKARKIKMPSLERYKDPKAQEERLREAGFLTVGHATIKDTWDQWIDSKEKERLDVLEGLDEVEEWHLLAAHYLLAWGTKGAGFGKFGEANMSKVV